MRFLNQFVWATALVALSSASLFAQGGGGAGGGGGGAGGGGMGGGGAGGGSSSLGGTTLSGLGSTPQISAPTGTSTGSTSVSASNFLGPYFANPYYQGILANQTSNNNNPGGFGMSLFSGTSGGGAGGGQIGFAGSSTTGTTSSLGGGRGGGGRSGSGSSQGWVVSNPSPISYRTFYSREEDIPQESLAVTSAKLQAAVASMLERSKATMPELAGVTATVQNVVDNNKNPYSVVVLSGKVADVRKVRAIVGLVNTMPGVVQVKSQLTFP